MSYRTEVNGTQIFGNNDAWPEWLEFIKSQGIGIDSDNWYEGYITDFEGALEACEKIALRIQSEHEKTMAELSEKCGGNIPEKLKNKYASLYDISYIKDKLDCRDDGPDRTTLFDELYGLVHCGYLFIPYLLFQACRPLLEYYEPEPGVPPRRLWNYRLKPGAAIHVSAG